VRARVMSRGPKKIETRGGAAGRFPLSPFPRFIFTKKIRKSFTGLLTFRFFFGIINNVFNKRVI